MASNVAVQHDIVAAAAWRARLYRNDRVFYCGMAAAAIAAMFIGFARTYFLRSRFFETSLPPLLRVHGVVFTAWFVIFLTQSVLVAARRVALHRSLGVAGAASAVVLVAVGLRTAIAAAHRDFAAGDVSALSFLAIPVGDMIVFLALVGAAVYYRRKTDIHKRLMLLATVSILDAAFARWPFALVAAGHVRFFAATDTLAAAGPVYDLASRRRIHPAYVWGWLFVVASQVLRVYISTTPPWLAFARAVATEIR